MYEIRLCRSDEIEKLQTFIANYWSKTHVFVSNQAILDFQHKENEHYNFVVACYADTGDFHGVLGFVSTSYYSAGSVAQGDDIWLALWKVEKSLAQSKSLGLDMLEFIEKRYETSSISAIGINNEVSLLYRLLGFKAGTMNQWFIRNDNMAEFQIARPCAKTLPEDKKFTSHGTISIRGVCFEELCNSLESSKLISSSKSRSYLMNRYGEHPTYRYEPFLIEENGSCIGGFVGRRVTANSASAFRVTDFFMRTDMQPDLRTAVTDFLADKNLEYLDILEFGNEFIDFSELGFQMNSVDSFVPHLFEPFVPEKRDVKLAYRGKSNFSCFKGDSDLDRPNVL